MNALALWWRGHGTKLICSLIGILEAAREIEGLVPEQHKKWVALAIIVLAGGGVRRGFTNSSNQGAQP
jgi:hypothetical protein